MMSFDNDNYRSQRPQGLHWWLRQPNGALGRIARHPHVHQQRQLQAVLPESLAGHWQMARLDTQALCLVTENSVWANQLRYRRNILLRCAESILGQRPQQLQIRIEPTIAIPPPKPPARLSTAAAETLQQSAECMDEGPLRDALLRLASRCADS